MSECCVHVCAWERRGGLTTRVSRQRAAELEREDMFIQECVKPYPIEVKLVDPLMISHRVVWVVADPKKNLAILSRRPRKLSAGLVNGRLTAIFVSLFLFQKH